ncbi:MAG: hypothetical protein U5Q03_04755 [Bacteroidota bacterium]|nr:hypothetical protein [Bacteroidota bacterium]
MAFQIDELQLRNDSEAEQIRTREIFEVLKTKATKHEKATEHEKGILLYGIKDFSP